MHTAYGVADLFPKGSQIHAGAGFEPPLPAQNPNPLGVCDSCKSVQRLPAGSIEPCRVCQNPLDPIDAREPKGFFTDFRPQDYDGVFEWTPRSTVPTLTWESQPTPGQLVGNSSVFNFSDDIISVNDNGGRGGFDFQKANISGIDNSEGAYAVNPGAHKRISVSGKEVSCLSAFQKEDRRSVGRNRELATGHFCGPSQSRRAGGVVLVRILHAQFRRRPDGR